MSSEVADWPEVKATAIALNNLKRTAEVHGISHDAVKQRAKREGWPVGRRVHKMAAEAKQSAANAIVARSNGRVTHVTTASEALENVIASDGKATRVAAIRYARKAVEHAEQLPASEGLEQAANVKSVLQGMAIADGSARGDTALPNTVNLLSACNVVIQSQPGPEVQESDKSGRDNAIDLSE